MPCYHTLHLSDATAPQHFERIAIYEEQFGKTIHRQFSVRELAAIGTPYQAALNNPQMVEIALSESYSLNPSTDRWELPAGAFRDSAGPS